MKTALRLFVLAICLSAIGGAIWLWVFLYPLAEVFLGVGHDRYEWNQKLTLTVATPDGDRTGSAVVQVVADFGKQLSGNEVAYGYRGEATLVEVAPGRWLFALLGGTEERYACTVGTEMNWGNGPWSPGPDSKDRKDWLAEITQMVGRPPAAVPHDCLPMLVTFDDINDPKTVRQVDPNDLAAAFGPGVLLKAVTLAVTDEPVTEGRVKTVFDYFWWPKAKRQQYTCRVYRCGLNPLRVYYSDGREDALSEMDFFAGEIK